ncbi:hypothetical protein [Maribacter sp. 2304DJ31-5]|uniref:hypothetical protein n=1 Tax=Maribacter sp. 2304DJ31-5 TaxID=3386273 RepID=UPI0039BD6C0C
MKTIIISVFVLFNYMGIGQVNLNEYKYIIVPKHFDGFKRENQYQTSTLVKYLLTQKGFSTVYDDALPDDLRKNRCLGLMTSLEDKSRLFRTGVIVTLKDCSGNAVFSTREGKSKIKAYKEAYSEALREAMGSFNNLNYEYKEKTEASEPITISFKNDVKKLDDKKPQANRSDVSEVSKNTNTAVVQKATETEQLYEDRQPIASDIKKGKNNELKKLKIHKPDPNDIWYAQSLSNGFQLVDSSPKVKMKLLKSSTDNVYMAQAEGKNGIVHKKEGKWVFEYYEGNKLIQEELNIKF